MPSRAAVILQDEMARIQNDYNKLAVDLEGIEVRRDVIKSKIDQAKRDLQALKKDYNRLVFNDGPDSD